MKIAIPSKGNQVDGHFGHCEYFTVFSVDDNNKIVSEHLIDPPAGCGCKSNVVSTLAEMGVKVMLAGNIGNGAVNVLNAHGIEVYRGCSGELREVAEAWLAGNVNDSGVGCTAHEGCDNHG
jgi:predicted Fe-Mo cluster-binding NifX family protein